MLEQHRNEQQMVESPLRRGLSSSERFALDGMLNGPTAAPAVDSRISVTYGDPWHLEPCDLLPPEAFHADGETPTDRQAIRAACGLQEDGTKERSAAVHARFFSCTAGWRTPPTSEEFYHAVQACAPTPRQKHVIEAWLSEAEQGEILRAWLEEAYSWRDLVAAMHRIGYRRNELSRYLNQFAKAPR